jgi:type I restriction enzyme S subunit
MEQELPNSWVEVQLIELLESLETGSRPKGGVQGILDGIPSVGGEHLNSDGGFKFDNIKYVPFKFAASMNRGEIKKNDILIVKDGATTGKTSFVDINFPFEQAFVNEHVFLCRPSKLINSKCLYYFLRSKIGQDRVMSNFAGAAQGGINTKFSNNTLVSIPPLPEQQRIVTKLDTLFGHLDALKTRLDRIPQLLKDFRQKVLTQAVTGKLTEEWREGRELEDWETKNLKQLGEVTGGITLNSGRNQLPLQMPYLRVANVYSNRLDLSEIKTIGVAEREIERTLLQKGDLLIVEGNGSPDQIGRVSQWNNEIENCLHQNHLIKFRPLKKINSTFVLYFILSDFGRQQIQEISKSSSGLYTLSLSKVSMLEIEITDLIEQQEIVRRVESLFTKADKIEASYQKLKEKTEQLPQAILAQAFRGELVEQLPTDGDARDLLEEIKKLKATGAGKSKKLTREEELDVAAEPGKRYGK